MSNRWKRGAQFVLLLVFAFFCHAAVSQQKPETSLLVLMGATVIDGSGAAPIPEAVVVIEGDKIKTVGPKGTNYPSGATVVDLSGKVIIPGLIDSHVHYEEWMGEMYLNHGVTTIFAIGGDWGRAKERSQQSDARTPRIYDSVGVLRHPASMTQEQVRNAVKQWLQKNPDFATLGSFNDRNKQVYQWTAEEVHRAGLMVFGHTEHAPDSIRAGQDVVEHIWGFSQATMTPKELADFQSGQYLHWAMFLRDWEKLDQLIKEAVDRGAYINPTFYFELGSLSAHAARHEQEAYRAYGNPSLMAYFPEGIANSLLQKQRQIRNFAAKYENLVLLSRLPAAEAEEFRRGYKLAGEFLKRFVQAGGKIQAGTDAPSGGTPGLSLLHEMDLLVEAGLTPMQALQSATSWSADKIAGKGRARGNPRIGSLAEASFADLVVLAASPLDDITNTRKIDRVMKGGKFIELGYTPTYFTFTRTPRRIAMATPTPEISAITPHTVVEGSPAFELTVEGVGFGAYSVIRVGGISMPTTFVNPRTLKVTVPADAVVRATPNRFDAPGPAQRVGVFGDRTALISVYNPPPEGGTSTSISLRIRAKGGLTGD